MYEFVVCACARWESPYIVEWINYYRAIGFDHIFLYCNDDSPDELLYKVMPYTQGDHPFVTFRFGHQQGTQREMYLHFIWNDIRRTKYVSFFDIDEFLKLPANFTIGKFMEGFEKDISGVVFNWLVFGPNGYEENAPDRILDNYFMRESNIHSHTKFICSSDILRSGPYGDSFWHNHKMNSQKFVNSIGESMENFYKNVSGVHYYVNDSNKSNKIISSGIIHHYPFRTKKSFQERVSRGLGGQFANQNMWGDMYNSDDRLNNYLEKLSEVEDRSLCDFWRNYIKRESENIVVI
jgi:hypothetical protein